MVEVYLLSPFGSQLQPKQIRTYASMVFTNGEKRKRKGQSYSVSSRTNDVSFLTDILHFSVTLYFPYSEPLFKTVFSLPVLWIPFIGQTGGTPFSSLQAEHVSIRLILILSEHQIEQLFLQRNNVGPLYLYTSRNFKRLSLLNTTEISL